jgi:hypothetical protein
MAVAVTEGTRQMADNGLFGYKNEGELHAAFDARKARRLGKMGRTVVIDRESAKAARVDGLHPDRKPLTDTELVGFDLSDLNNTTEFWCTCDDGGLEPRYVPDGEHTHCGKHHWDCARCGRVVQVG